ncbi:hypothetical protein QWA68_009351 [Fusarium oxysporum]|nr:hypothetical protein QWA68_009351 [Fusarium oxysporum]
MRKTMPSNWAVAPWHLASRRELLYTKRSRPHARVNHIGVLSRLLRTSGSLPITGPTVYQRTTITTVNAWVLRQVESDVVSHMIMKITAFFTQFVCSLPTEIV